MNKETGQYDEEEFVKYPDKYTSTFKTKVSYLKLKFFFFLININFLQNILSQGKKNIFIEKKNTIAALYICDLCRLYVFFVLIHF